MHEGGAKSAEIAWFLTSVIELLLSFKRRWRMKGANTHTHTHVHTHKQIHHHMPLRLHPSAYTVINFLPLLLHFLSPFSFLHSLCFPPQKNHTPDCSSIFPRFSITVVQNAWLRRGHTSSVLRSSVTICGRWRGPGRFSNILSSCRGSMAVNPGRIL